MKYRPEDVLAMILYHLYEKGIRKFESDPVSIHPIFFEWRNADRSKDMLSGFIFDTRDYFPFSDTLEESLDALQFAGYLERTNPKGAFYEIQPNIEKLYTKLKARFKEEDISIVNRFADDLNSKLKTKKAA